MSSIHFVNVASLVPNQRHCNLKLRVLSVETIAETIHPENQVNLLARNARLQLLNAHVNMYRGFMRLEVNEEEEEEDQGANDGGRERASITAILDDEEVNGPVDERDQIEGRAAAAAVESTPNHSGTNSALSTAAASSSIPTVATVSAETSPAVTRPAPSVLMPPPTDASGASPSSSSSSTAMSSIALSASTLPSSSRDQMEVEMRLGTGGSVSLMEYYRTMEYTYFSTVEPVGR
ncbi:hypothetical protein BGZ72_010161 [Mortierella alpina]|nr:hypothetical protein BGZ72_010161 [Mortierella alpina]